MSESAENDTVDEATPLNAPNPPLTFAVLDVEEVPLSTIPGSGTQQGNSAGNGAVVRLARKSCCHDEHHRKLAIGSIICGFTCIGCKALINSVKAETATDPEAARKFSHRARKLGIISIVLWLVFLASIPSLMALVSYVLTFFD